MILGDLTSRNFNTVTTWYDLYDSLGWDAYGVREPHQKTLVTDGNSVIKRESNPIGETNAANPNKAREILIG